MTAAWSSSAHVVRKIRGRYHLMFQVCAEMAVGKIFWGRVWVGEVILGRGWIWVGGVEKVILCYDNPMPISAPSGRKPPPKCRKPVSDNFAQTRGGIASGPAPAAGASIADGDAERGGGAQPAHAQPS